MVRKKIVFRRVITTSGHSYVITIPKDFVKQGMIDPAKEYNIIMEEVRKNG